MLTLKQIKERYMYDTDFIIVLRAPFVIRKTINIKYRSQTNYKKHYIMCFVTDIWKVGQNYLSMLVMYLFRGDRWCSVCDESLCFLLVTIFFHHLSLFLETQKSNVFITKHIV